MPDVTQSDRTRRRFLEELGVSAATIVAGGGICRLQAGATGRSARASGGIESPDTPPAKTPRVRQEIDLAGRWRFQVDCRDDIQKLIDDQDEGQELAYFSPAFPTQDWREVTIPRAFDDCAPGMYKFRGICWFSRQFEVPASMRGRRVVAHFEGVNYSSSVWVNGKLVGRNEDAFLPFEFPVDEHLRYGESNLIVVRVDNLRRPAQLPTSEYWQGQGGILREVKLVASDQARVTHVSVMAVPGNDKGKFTLRATVTNGRSESATFSLHVKILNREGQPLASFASTDLTIEPGKDGDFTVEGEVREVVAWSPERPVLYTVRVELLVGGMPADQQETRFGFRRIEARDGKLWLNGKPLFLMGFDRHEDSPRTGMAVDLETSRQDFLVLLR
ncbi:MAG: sugar-binding domain-containing protein [Terriglobia bacterium]